MGTGRLVREFIYSLPDEFYSIGVVRHQLPRLKDVPFTSNNSSACALVNVREDEDIAILRRLAVEHLMQYCAPGSDPGLCIAKASDVGNGLVEFGQKVTGELVTQKAAMDMARDIELYGLGGTNDGIIGACAAVGLTKFGWCGRFIEYGTLRMLGRDLTVQDLIDADIQVVSTDRDPLVPLPHHRVTNAKWIRPSMWNGKPMLQVRMLEMGVWEPAHGKRKKQHAMPKPKEAVTLPYTV